MVTQPRATLDMAVRNFVRDGSGVIPVDMRPDDGLDSGLLRVVDGHSRGSSPGRPYATVLRMMDNIEGIPYTQPLYVYNDQGELDPNVDTNYYTVAEMRGHFSVQWYGPLAYDFATRFCLWLTRPTALDLARRDDFVVVDVPEPEQTNAIDADVYERRAMITLEIGYNQIIEETVPYIGQGDTSVRISTIDNAIITVTR